MPKIRLLWRCRSLHVCVDTRYWFSHWWDRGGKWETSKTSFLSFSDTSWALFKLSEYWILAKIGNKLRSSLASRVIVASKPKKQISKVGSFTLETVDCWVSFWALQISTLCLFVSYVCWYLMSWKWLINQQFFSSMTEPQWPTHQLISWVKIPAFQKQKKVNTKTMSDRLMKWNKNSVQLGLQNRLSLTKQLLHVENLQPCKCK